MNFLNNMKILFTFILMLTTFVVSAQSRTIDLDSIYKAPKTEAQLLQNSTRTTAFAIYKETKYPVYQSASGKPFIIVKAKTSGNLYRKYFDWDMSTKKLN
jgi:hypothetical protein